MATNLRQRLSPPLEVPVCAGAHVSGELAYEANKFGVAVETNAVGGHNQFIQHGKALLPVPAALAVGTPVYATGTTFTNGATVQAWSATPRGTAVASTLTATATGNTLIGYISGVPYADGTTGASAAFGATTVAEIELKPQ